MSWEWSYLIPIIYLIGMVVIGVLISNKQETRSDFYVASNKMNPAVLFATIFATTTGANGYMGFSGSVYSGGFSGIWLLIAAGFSYYLLFFISGKIRRIATKYEVFTLPDILELRYSKPVALVVTLFSFIGLVGGAGGAMLGIGMILNSLIGMDITLAVIITGIVTIVYTAFGGLMGVALTDWVQAILMIFGIVLIIVFGVILLAGDSNFFTAAMNSGDQLSATLGNQFLSLTEGITLIIVLSWVFTFTPLNTISQVQIQRIYAAKNEKTIQRVSLLMTFFILFLAFGLGLVGVIGKSLLPGLSNPEMVFPTLALELINPYVGMIIVTAILAAAMSTVDSNLLGAGIHVSRDLYERYRDSKETIKENTIINLSRITIVVIGVISMITALVAPSILSLILITMSIFAGATLVPVLSGLFWRRANSAGAMSGVLLGGFSTLFAIMMKTSIDPILIGIMFSFAGMVIVTLMTKPETEKGDILNFSADGKKDYPFLIIIVTLTVLFLLGLTNIKMWGILIILSTAALVLTMILLIVFIFSKKETKKQDVNPEQPFDI